MADLENKTEEAKAEEAKAEEVKAEEAKVEEEKAEATKEVTELNDAFDKKMDSDEDDAAVEDTSDEKTPEGKAEEKTAENTDTGEAGQAEQPAEEKEIDEAAKVIEDQLIADAGKTEAQKEADVAAKKAADDAKSAEEAKAKEADKYVSDYDPEKWDDDAIAEDTKRGQRALDQQNALQKQNAELRGTIQSQANQRHADWLDRKINALGEDFHEKLGEGDWEDLEPASEQLENRVRISARMAVVQQAYVKLNKPIPSRNKLFKSAVTYLFKTEKNKAKSEAETIAKAKKKAGQVMGSSSGKATKISAAAAIKNLNEEFDKKLDEDD